MKIRVKSITYAMKAKELAQQMGITASVVKDLRPSGSGCVYAISFSDDYREAMFDLLRQNGIMLHPSEKWENLL